MALKIRNQKWLFYSEKCPLNRNGVTQVMPVFGCYFRVILGCEGGCILTGIKYGCRLGQIRPSQPAEMPQHVERRGQ
jgi:hypothetical protein